jgi:hypothetical protein
MLRPQCDTPPLFSCGQRIPGSHLKKEIRAVLVHKKIGTWMDGIQFFKKTKSRFQFLKSDPVSGNLDQNQ